MHQWIRERSDWLKKDIALAGRTFALVSDLTTFEQKDANFADFLAFFIIEIFYTIESVTNF